MYWYFLNGNLKTSQSFQPVNWNMVAASHCLSQVCRNCNFILFFITQLNLLFEPPMPFDCRRHKCIHLMVQIIFPGLNLVSLRSFFFCLVPGMSPDTQKQVSDQKFSAFIHVGTHWDELSTPLGLGYHLPSKWHSLRFPSHTRFLNLLPWCFLLWDSSIITSFVWCSQRHEEGGHLFLCVCVGAHVRARTPTGNVGTVLGSLGPKWLHSSMSWWHRTAMWLQPPRIPVRKQILGVLNSQILEHVMYLYPWTSSKIICISRTFTLLNSFIFLLIHILYFKSMDSSLVPQ